MQEKKRLRTFGRRWPSYWLIGGAVTIAGLSSRVQWSYDEAIWLGVVRKVASGAQLYVGAIDNKAPTVLGLSWALDWVPGPYVLARGVLVGSAVAMVMFAATRLARLTGSGAGWSYVVGGFVGIAIALESSLVLTVELVGVTLVFGSLLCMASDARRLGVFLAAAAAAFDPRVVLLFPAILLLVERTGGRRKMLSATIALVFLATAGILLLMIGGDNVRFSLLDLNVASRRSLGFWPIGQQVFTAAEVLLPVLTLVCVARASLPSKPLIGWMLSGGALLIALGSIMPFSHYWVYTALALPFLLGQPRRFDFARPVLPALVAVSLAPLSILAVGSAQTSNGAFAKYAEVAAILHTRLGPEGTFVEVDDQPYLTALLASHSGLRSPVLGYVVWPTSRRAAYLAEVPRLIDRAQAMVDNGALDADTTQPRPAYVDVVAAFLAQRDEFDCPQTVADVTVRFRDCRDATH